MLIENTGATIHDRNINDDNVTLLHVVGRACDGKDCVKKSSIAIFVIDFGADVNANDSYSYTPLHNTAQSGKSTNDVRRLTED